MLSQHTPILKPLLRMFDWLIQTWNLGLQPSTSRASLESLMSDGGSPGQERHISVLIGGAVTFSLVRTTSATESLGRYQG
jgi:hypothetical protein